MFILFYFIPLLKGLKLELKLTKSVIFWGKFWSFFWEKKVKILKNIPFF
jgi:hypothetical protein